MVMNYIAAPVSVATGRINIVLYYSKIKNPYQNYDDFGPRYEEFGRHYVQNGCLISELNGTKLISLECNKELYISTLCLIKQT